LLRGYYLGDRDRTQIEARFNHSPLDNLNVDFGVRYALDDYTNTQIGLTESKDTNYDINLSYMINDDMNVNTFYNHQIIKSAQSGSANLSIATWQADIEDTVDVVGAGLS